LIHAHRSLHVTGKTVNKARVEPTAILKSLSDPTRRALFERLSREGELTVHALTFPSGVTQPAVSKHLNSLRLAGLVRRRRDGRETYYRAIPEGLIPLFDWLKFYAAFWQSRFQQLEDLLNRTED
jgi:DNA-binding transcriptional ArsR family regulator